MNSFFELDQIRGFNVISCRRQFNFLNLATKSPGRVKMEVLDNKSKNSKLSEIQNEIFSISNNMSNDYF